MSAMRSLPPRSRWVRFDGTTVWIYRFGHPREKRAPVLAPRVPSDHPSASDVEQGPQTFPHGSSPGWLERDKSKASKDGPDKVRHSSRARQTAARPWATTYDRMYIRQHSPLLAGG